MHEKMLKRIWTKNWMQTALSPACRYTVGLHAWRRPPIFFGSKAWARQCRKNNIPRLYLTLRRFASFPFENAPVNQADLSAGQMVAKTKDQCREIRVVDMNFLEGFGDVRMSSWAIQSVLALFMRLRDAIRVMSWDHVAECHCHRLGARVKMLSTTKNEVYCQMLD